METKAQQDSPQTGASSKPTSTTEHTGLLSEAEARILITDILKRLDVDTVCGIEDNEAWIQAAKGVLGSVYSSISLAMDYPSVRPTPIELPSILAYLARISK